MAVGTMAKGKKRDRGPKPKKPPPPSTSAPAPAPAPAPTMPSATINVDAVDLSPLWKEYRPHSSVLFDASTKWHTLVPEEPPGKVDPTSPSTKANLKELAAKILQQEVQNYDKAEASGGKGRDVKFRQTVFTHGTSRDKVAAHTLRCMEAPVHSLSNLRALIAMVTPKAKGTFEEILSSLTELFTSTFLPNGRVAQRFECHNCASLGPLLAKGREKAERQLALWHFEDQLAATYHRLVHQLAQVCKEEVEHNKMRAIRALVELLKHNPRQNAPQILQVTANKLGDPTRRVAAHTMYCLRTLLQRAPHLKSQVLAEVEVMLYRPNVSTKAQYYGLCFLKDMIFCKGRDKRVAAELVKLYFGFFKACTKKGEVDTRLMSALLRGLNRAFPYSGLGGVALEEQLGTLYKLCHMVTFNTATQALQLVFQVLSSTQGQISDRFYQVLYRCMLDPSFGTSTGTTAYLNLVYKALSNDASDHRTLAFFKRLLQVSQYLGPNIVCGIVYLMSEVVKERPTLHHSLSALLRSPSTTKDEDDLEVYPDAEDVEVEDVEEEEEEEDGKDKKNEEEEVDDDDVEMVSDIKEEEEDDDDKGEKEEEEESYDDDDDDEIQEIKKEEDDNEDEKTSEQFTTTTTTTTTTDTKPPPNTTSSWHHLLNPWGGEGGASRQVRGEYDPLHRNPLFCGAQFSSLWELEYLKAHYHPSVSVFAGKVLEGQPVDYSGDPLQDFTLIRFLDRFVYRNPKKMSGSGKDNAGSHVLGRRSQYTPQGVRGIAVNTEEFSALEPHQVPEDEVFFHRYFTQFKAGQKKGVDDKGEESESDESVADEEFDAFLGKREGGGGDVGEEYEEDDEEMMGVDVGEEVDFAAGVKVKNERKGKGKDDEGDDDDDDDGDDFEEEFGSDGDDDDDGKMDFGEDDDGDEDGDDGGGDEDDDLGFDEEAVAFSDDDFDEPPKKKIKGNTKLGKGEGKKKKRGWGGDDDDGDGEGVSSMFASAESFAHMLEDNEAGGDPGSGTSQALANRDRAHAKQLTWEVERERKMKRENWRNKKMGQRKDKRGMGGKRGGKGGMGMKKGGGRVMKKKGGGGGGGGFKGPKGVLKRGGKKKMKGRN